MGDYRNKIRKLLDDQRIDQRMAESRAADEVRARSVPRCACGNTWNDVPVLLSYKGGYWEPMVYYCPGCCPPQFLPDMLALTVKRRAAYLPEDDPAEPGTLGGG